MKELWTTFIHDKMLIIASVVAFLSMLIVPPDAMYLSYFNGRTLVSMWLLMMVIAGLRRNHFFRWLARRLLQVGDKAHHVVLALLFFAFAMATFVTNDVAIFITLPLAMRTLRGAGLMQYGAFVAVLVGLAANCGSMLTPIGNPQNMFLFSATQLTALEIVKTTGPFALLAALLMYRRVSTHLPHTPITIQEFKPLSAQSKRNIALYLGALFVALLAIGNVLPLYPTAGVLFILTYLIYPHTHRHVDYGLLLTLCAFFYHRRQRRPHGLARRLYCAAADALAVYHRARLESMYQRCADRDITRTVRRAAALSFARRESRRVGKPCRQSREPHRVPPLQT